MFIEYLAEAGTGRAVTTGNHLQRLLQHERDRDLKKRNTINANPHSFMENRIWQTKTHLFSGITSLIDNNIGGVIYLDFCKAIDLVLYDILIKQLEQYTVNMAHIKQIKSWLSDVSQMQL